MVLRTLPLALAEASLDDPDFVEKGRSWLLPLLVAESGRLRPSGAAGANFFGGAVWGGFRENANCGDPPGTLYIPCTFRRGLIRENPAKIRQNLAEI